MLYSTFGASALLAASALASPIQSRESNIDIVVLQYALTAENLEDVFYKQALQNFTQQDFLDAGFTETYYDDLHYVAADEQEHTEFLKGALKAAGVKPNEACTYDFGYKDVTGFVKLAAVIESLGTSAYLGGATVITNPGYLSAAAAIEGKEAQHTGFQRLAVFELPFVPPFCTPLDPTSVYTILARFITSCPSGNMALPFTPFSTLMYVQPNSTSSSSYSAASASSAMPSESGCADSQKSSSGGWEGSMKYGSSWWQSMSHESSTPMAGDQVTVELAKGSVPSGIYVTFVSGLSVVSVKPDSVDGQQVTATIPTNGVDGTASNGTAGIVYGIEGQVYAYLTNSSMTGSAPYQFSDKEVVAGPAIIEVAPGAPRIDYSES